MTVDHLVGDRGGHVLEAEGAGFARHLRMVDDLQQQVAELLAQMFEIAPADRVGDLVSLLDRVWRDGGEALFQVPRATRARRV